MLDLLYLPYSFTKYKTVYLLGCSKRSTTYAGHFACSHDGACGRQNHKLMLQRGRDRSAAILTSGRLDWKEYNVSEKAS